MRSLASRLKVVGPAFAVGSMVAGVFAMRVPDAAPEIWLSSLAGPFAGLWAAGNWTEADAVGWGLACLVAIAAHPLRHGWLAGAASAAGVGLWVLWGLALTFDGV